MSLSELSQDPVQHLPRAAYTCPDWYAREQERLFGRNWIFAGVTMDYPEVGDYRVIPAGAHRLIVIRDQDGGMRAFHNICRHRGTELLEGQGNTGRTIMCPYHNWVYNLDGRLRGVPAQRECFATLDKSASGLLAASIGVFRDLVFVHPEADPTETFEDWCAGLDTVTWPHDLASADMAEGSEEVVYELECNWKVFYENALDGYHLAYLHKNTLGGPTHDNNIWESFGRHMVWWSTERDGVKNRIPVYVEESTKGSGLKVVPGGDVPGYGGVYALYPSTLLTPNPWGFSVSSLEPVSPTKSILRVRSWAPKGWFSYTYKAKDVPGYDAQTATVKSSHWTVHPLETGDFQTEDIWVCERMQRGMAQPRYAAGPLATGSGGEAALAYFQSIVARDMAG